MAIINLEAVKGAVRHSATVEGGRTYSIELLAEVDSLATGPITIRDRLALLGYAPGSTYRWPLAGSVAEQDLGSFLRGIEVEPSAEDGLQYRVTLNYGPNDPAQDGVDSGSNSNSNWIQVPWYAPPTLQWSAEEIEIALTHDRTGQPILNKAGDPFDPPLTISETVPVATVTRIEKSFDPAWITYFKGAINDAQWYDWDAGSVLCQTISADRTHDADWGALWRVSYSFAFRPPIELPPEAPWEDAKLRAGWAVQVLNAGLRQKVGNDRKPILDDGAPVSSPVPLDDDGKPLKPDDEPKYLIFDVLPEADFSLFNFPADLFSASTP